MNEGVKTNMTPFMEGMKKLFAYECDTVDGNRGWLLNTRLKSSSSSKEK